HRAAPPGRKGAFPYMDLVSFPCGYCGQPMTVGHDRLGQEVQCPHCQQVVQAPALQSTAAAPAPVFDVSASPGPGSADEAPVITVTVPVRSEEESIFSPAEESDDLFGEETGSKLELPPELAPPAPEPPRSAAPVEAPQPASSLSREIVMAPPPQPEAG